jgi:hypothetical protein
MENKPEKNNSLFERVACILEEARLRVVRSVNSNMVLAYWLIGREIVQELQRGEERADYGAKVIEDLSKRLTEQYGKGFSTTNLWYFRQFYQVYFNRLLILYPSGGESVKAGKIHPSGGELSFSENHCFTEIQSTNGFSPLLSWSHYRALMRVKNEKARLFYEQEAIECGWSKAQLERQIHSSYYERILANSGEAGLISKSRDRLPGEPLSPETVLKSPYVLEFLGLPDSSSLHESVLERELSGIVPDYSTFWQKQKSL